MQHPLKVHTLRLVGHQRSVFRTAERGEIPHLDTFHSRLILMFDPVELHLVGLDPTWHCRTDVCATLRSRSLKWTRLKAVAFCGASLFCPLRATAFGPALNRQARPLLVTFEIQDSPPFSNRQPSVSDVAWLSNLSWHIFQRDTMGYGRYTSFPHRLIPRITVLVKSARDLDQVQEVLEVSSKTALPLALADDRMCHISLAVGRVCAPARGGKSRATITSPNEGNAPGLGPPTTLPVI